MIGEQATKRTVLAISGNDRADFLQGLITNDIAGLDQGLVYAAVLSPQGKYLADFFLMAQDDHILLDVADSLSQVLTQRLNMYKLRADVAIEPSEQNVVRGLGTAPKGAVADPRHADLGWRSYTQDAAGPETIDWDAIRVAHCIPETSVELLPNETFILETGFERLSGVDFRKGCYVGQEVTARMKHKTELRKGLTSVRIDADVPVGTEILANDRTVGRVFTQSGGRAIAYLRYDRAGAEMTADGATVTWPVP